jgi:hypothetical protein
MVQMILRSWTWAVRWPGSPAPTQTHFSRRLLPGWHWLSTLQGTHAVTEGMACSSIKLCAPAQFLELQALHAPAQAFPTSRRGQAIGAVVAAAIARQLHPCNDMCVARGLHVPLHTGDYSGAWSLGLINQGKVERIPVCWDSNHAMCGPDQVRGNTAGTPGDGRC